MVNGEMEGLMEHLEDVSWYTRETPSASTKVSTKSSSGYKYLLFPPQNVSFLPGEEVH